MGERKRRVAGAAQRPPPAPAARFVRRLRSECPSAPIGSLVCPHSVGGADGFARESVAVIRVRPSRCPTTATDVCSCGLSAGRLERYTDIGSIRI